MLTKGQMFSVDFLIACSIFLVMMIIIYLYWGYATLQIEDTVLTNDMTDKLNLASQAWFKEGTPKYWGSSDVVELGLSNGHSFNWTKMDLLKNSIGYGRALTLIGVEEYYLYYRVANETNSTLFEFGDYPSNPDNVMKTERFGLLENSIAVVEVILWR